MQIYAKFGKKSVNLQLIMRNALLIVLCCAFVWCKAQTHGSEHRMMCYNVENLFDCRHDSLKDDYQFLPDSARRWSEYRLQRKLVDISRVIVSAGGFDPMACIGLCEVENRSVLERLTRGPLQRFGYQIIHQDSPDRRGIDVALLYNPRVFKPLITSFLPVIYSGDSTFVTRDILYCKALLGKRDTLHVMMCHLPSQRAENEDADMKRMAAFKVIRHITDSLTDTDKCANIIVMGDFNCPANDKHYRKAMLRDSNLNDMVDKFTGSEAGTYCYQGVYSCIDHIVVSDAMADSTGCGTLSLNITDVQIHAEDWMLDKPNKQGVRYPYRTYRGQYYHGGISDHLPLVFTVRGKE